MSPVDNVVRREDLVLAVGLVAVIVGDLHAVAEK